MGDFIDKYEGLTFPGLLELLFFLVLVVDLIMAIWATFIGQMHISTMPYLNTLYIIIIPIAYIAPLSIAICIKKIKKHLILVVNIYMGLRISYLSFIFYNEILYRLAEKAIDINEEAASSTINSGIFCIVFTIVFSLICIIILNVSKKIKYYISNQDNNNIILSRNDE